MQQQAIPRLFMVQRLYRRVLKLHRYLPTELKKLGDEYAKDEFRRHRDTDQIQAYEFMGEWKVNFVNVLVYIKSCLKKNDKINFSKKSHFLKNVSKFKGRYEKTMRFTQCIVQVGMRL